MIWRWYPDGVVGKGGGGGVMIELVGEFFMVDMKERLVLMSMK